MNGCHITDNIHVIIIDKTIIIEIFKLSHARVSQLSRRTFVHTTMQVIVRENSGSNIRNTFLQGIHTIFIGKIIGSIESVSC